MSTKGTKMINDFRPSAYPIITIDPYISIWADSDRPDTYPIPSTGLHSFRYYFAVFLRSSITHLNPFNSLTKSNIVSFCTHSRTS